MLHELGDKNLYGLTFVLLVLLVHNADSVRIIGNISHVDIAMTSCHVVCRALPPGGTALHKRNCQS